MGFGKCDYEQRKVIRLCRSYYTYKSEPIGCRIFLNSKLK